MGRSLRLALLGAWLGAILLFAIAVAPNVFAVLAPHEGGRALAGLHYFGLACGGLFLLLKRRRFVTTGNMFVLAMLALTLYSQFWISPMAHFWSHEPKMIGAPASEFERLPADHPARRHFATWHRISTTTEVLILLLGSIAVVLESRRHPEGQ